MMRYTTRSGGPASRLATAARRFAAEPSGATAVEFALVSMPFFLLLMGTFELGLIFLLSTTLDKSMGEAARQIRTGQLQTATTAPTPASFRKLVCDDLGWLQGQCDANLRIEVRSFPSFGAVAMTPPMNGTAYDPSKLNGYADTAPGCVVVVRGFYRWTLVVPLMDKALQRLPDGTKLITSTVTFQTEPFTQPASSTASC